MLPLGERKIWVVLFVAFIFSGDLLYALGPDEGVLMVQYWDLAEREPLSMHQYYLLKIKKNIFGSQSTIFFHRLKS